MNNDFYRDFSLKDYKAERSPFLKIDFYKKEVEKVLNELPPENQYIVLKSLMDSIIEDCDKALKES